VLFYVLFVLIVLFYVLFVCKCVLYYCHQVATQLQLHISYHILIYIQQDTTLHSLFYPETALHVLGGIITHHQGRKQLYLQHLVFVTALLLPAASSR